MEFIIYTSFLNFYVGANLILEPWSRAKDPRFSLEPWVQNQALTKKPTSTLTPLPHAFTSNLGLKPWPQTLASNLGLKPQHPEFGYPWFGYPGYGYLCLFTPSLGTLGLGTPVWVPLSGYPRLGNPVWVPPSGYPGMGTPVWVPPSWYLRLGTPGLSTPGLGTPCLGTFGLSTPEQNTAEI